MKLKRIISAILAAATLTMCMSFTAFAAAEPTKKTGTITVENTPSKTNISIIGRKYNAYRVFDLVMNDDNTAYAYTLNSAFESTTDSDGNVTKNGLFTSDDFKKAFADAEVNENKTSTMYKFVSELNAADLQKFANLVYDYATAEGSDVTEYTSAEATKVSAEGADTVEQAVFSNLDLGYYLVYGKGTPLDNAEAEVVTACALDTTTWDADKSAYDVTINVKVSVPTVDKKIIKDKGAAGEKETSADSANIGDKVDFKVSSIVPDLTGYNKYTFKMTDTMSKGLTYNNDMVVKINGIEMKSGTDYTVTGPTEVKDVEDNVTGYTIVVEFSNFYNLITNKYSYTDGDVSKEAAFEKGMSIIYEYSATLNKDAVLAGSANENKAKIIYSNNPHEDTTNDTNEVDVNVYTFELDVFKFTQQKTAESQTAEADAQETASQTQTQSAQPAETSSSVQSSDEPEISTTASSTETQGEPSETTSAEVSPSETVTTSLEKTEEADDRIPLSGAEFEIRKNGSADKLKFIKISDGVYRTALSDEEGAGTSVISDNNGKIKVQGLGAGEYALKEIKAPDGYNLLEEEVVVKIVPTYTGNTLNANGLTIPEGAKYTALAENAGISVDVLNLTGNELPSTGGMGTKLIYIIGGLLIVISVVCITVRKMAKRKG